MRRRYPALLPHPGQAGHRIAGLLACHLIGGRYVDELEKRGGEWRIIKRRYIADWSHEFDNGLDELVASGFAVNVLNILEPGHKAYRPL
ncbi:hypothetical protein [Halioglobus sp. HI00S01]|uniref:hypothetical protein n=1 Tax=Halioglobus sp. HI00S01 TaxID=1822214 RepID=UPI0012E72976|nr:hypothetical protein [Halioglobus sp. HI00S01]